jgi:hypothetical protein
MTAILSLVDHSRENPDGSLASRFRGVARTVAPGAFVLPASRQTRLNVAAASS